MLSQQSGEVLDWPETEILFLRLRPIALEAPGWPEYGSGAGHDIERPSASLVQRSTTPCSPLQATTANYAAPQGVGVYS